MTKEKFTRKPGLVAATANINAAIMTASYSEGKDVTVSIKDITIVLKALDEAERNYFEWSVNR